jgi:hypothetical protein
MKNLEIVRSNSTNDEYFKKLLKTAELEAKFISWNDGRVSNHLPALLVVDEDHIEQIIEICEERDLKVIIALNSRKEFKLISKFKEHFKSIFGFLDLSQELDYNTPLLLNYINLNFSSHVVKLDKLSNDLSKILEFTKSELNRVKDLHDKFIKIRVDDFKDISVSSKFMAGEKSGGEFFDLIQGEDSFLYLQAGSNSYIISSLILSEFENLKLSLPKSNLSSLAIEFEKVINHHAKENHAELNYCIVVADFKKHSMDVSTKGNGAIVYQNQLLDYSKLGTIKFLPGEKIILISSGALKNLAALNHQLNLQKFFDEHADKSNKDLINEFFFELSRNKAGHFLVYDALMSILEIDAKKLYSLNS